MEDLFHSITKLLAHNIVVHIYSLPNFSIESFVTSLICIVHILLIVEVNSLVGQITEKSIAKLRRQRIMRDDSRPSSRASLHSNETHVKMQHHLRKYYESHSPFLPHNHNQNKLSKINELEKSNYNWISLSPVDGEKYEKIDQILSVSPSDYIKKDKEKKIHENELRHCLKSLTTLLECSVASKMSNTSLAKSISIIKNHLKSSNSCENITDNKKTIENNRNTTESLFDMMERSLTLSTKEDGMTSHGDVARMGSLEESFSVYSSPSDTSADVDLDSQSNVTDVKQ
ncbi:hypothetical protein HHI36_003550 [Cryptolaemus montrouzieri]|uniref:Uncharacterized protein n=1 Tax=Cryptolaemus montrouzieri TaxID=559131 RepID=A0ABD2PDZ0_9CUCU